MTSPYPVLGQAPVTAAAMRAAADLVEASGITGLAVTCGDGQITIHVTDRAGDAPARAAVVARLAALLGGTAAQADSPGQGMSWITAHGVIGAIPARVFTAIEVACTDDPGSGRRLPLAASPSGQAAVAAPGTGLPPGWRWVTELDGAPAAAAARPQEVA
jgi:hypothetical protein